jgi:hypothetical protein
LTKPVPPVQKPTVHHDRSRTQRFPETNQAVEQRVMPLRRIVPPAALLLSAAAPVPGDWEIPRLNIYQLAYPIEWNGLTFMLGARLQLPVEANGKMPAVIMMDGTSGIRYSGVYYAAALNAAGIATLEVDQWGGRALPAEPASRPKGLGDNLSDIGGSYRLFAVRPDIDAARIGLMGSSMGAGHLCGHIPILTLTPSHPPHTLRRAQQPGGPNHDRTQRHRGTAPALPPLVR